MLTRCLSLVLLSVIALSGPLSLAAAKRKSARPETEIRPPMDPVGAFNKAYAVEFELVWIRLPQPLSEVSGLKGTVKKMIRQANPFARSSTVALSVTLPGQESVAAQGTADLYEGASNMLTTPVHLKIPGALVGITKDGNPAVNFALDVTDSEDLFEAKVTLPLNEAFLQASRKQFIGSAIDEKMELKTHPMLFPVRIGESNFIPLSQGNHAEGSAIIAIHLEPKTPASEPLTAPCPAQRCLLPFRLAAAKRKGSRHLSFGDGSEPTPGDFRIRRAAVDLGFCTGTLIADRVVLTAAHCLEQQWPASARASLMYQGIPVVDAFVSMDTYSRLATNQTIHDVALLYLQSNPPESEVIPLAQPEQTFEKYVRLGFGLRAGSDGWIDSKLQKKLKLSKVHLQKPRDTGPIRFAQPMERTCPGDSGGPTLGLDHGKWYLVGVTSMVKSNLFHRFDWIKMLIQRGDIPDYKFFCGDYYTAERVTENLDIIKKGIQALHDRNPI